MKNSPEILFFDDFTDPHLNRDFWNVQTTGKIFNHELQAYVDSPETVSLSQDEPNARGALVLQAHYRPGAQTPQGAALDFISGRIHTREKATFRYGRVSARLKLPAQPGAWPAFWALGASGRWPLCGEIDVMESVGEADWVSAAAHGAGYSGERALVNKKYFQAPAAADEWHVYAAECSPDGLFFFVDDELIYRVTRPMVEFFGAWRFDGEKFLILNLALGGTYPFKTTGAKEPYYGLPAETLEFIKREPIRFLADWVKITAL
jgi:beta-glucanase (GH16 family)